MTLAVTAVVTEMVSACGTSTLKADEAAKFVTDTVSEQNAFTPTGVTCPQNLEAKAGTTFDCTFVGPENTRYVAHMTVLDVQGEYATFELSGLTPTG